MGIVRVFQGWANDKPVSYLFMEMLVLFFLSMMITQFLSRKSIVFGKVEALTKENKEAGLLPGDAVVRSFAFNGGCGGGGCGGCGS